MDFIEWSLRSVSWKTLNYNPKSTSILTFSLNPSNDKYTANRCKNIWVILNTFRSLYSTVHTNLNKIINLALIFLRLQSTWIWHLFSTVCFIPILIWYLFYCVSKFLFFIFSVHEQTNECHSILSNERICATFFLFSIVLFHIDFFDRFAALALWHDFISWLFILFLLFCVSFIVRKLFNHYDVMDLNR